MMNLIRRSLYLGYYLKELDWESFKKYFTYVRHHYNMSSIHLWRDLLASVYRYNVGLMDYFIFRFFDKGHHERIKWVGTGYKYEFDLMMNPIKSRDIIRNKILFLKAYEKFIKHAYCSLDDLEAMNDKALQVLNNPSGKIVVKDVLGQCGWEVEVLNAKDRRGGELKSYMKDKGFNLLESFIVQHPQIERLSASGLNTIRVVTMVNKDQKVDILAARMRISVNNHVDNLASGNIACPIDLHTGMINGKGVYSDITKESVTHHPISGVQLVGFQIPMWDEILDLCSRAALLYPQNRGIGWDVALTLDGPEFIEGNHNWCKILWQLPVNTGMKDVLEEYLIGIR